LRRDDAPADDDDVVAALGLQGLDELGYECLVAGRLRRYPDDVDVVLDGVAGRFLRGLEQRSDVDVETDVREGRRDDLGAAVVAVLAEFHDEQAGPPALVLREVLDALLDAGE